MWKRISAGLFDWILTVTLAVGLAVLLSAVLGYDNYSQTVEDAYAKYGELYHVDFNISQEEYASLPQDVLDRYEEANKAMNEDAEAVHAYSMMSSLMLLIASAAILIAILLMEFVVPLMLKEGRTLGKKIFGICLIRTDGVRVNNLQLFTRTILGKFAVETMLPVYILLNLFFGSGIGMFGTVILFGLGIAQVAIICFTRNNSLIHDLLAGTTVVDFASQRIFRSTDDLIEYQKQVAAERAARQTY